VTTAAFRGLRRAVFRRAESRCECGCRTYIDEASGHLDHFFGRGAGRPPESVSNCWALSVRCDHQKTCSEPSAAEWLARFQEHAERYGYTDERERANARLQALVAKGLATIQETT